MRVLEGWAFSYERGTPVGAVRAQFGRRDVRAPPKGGTCPRFLSHTHHTPHTHSLTYSLSLSSTHTHTHTISLTHTRTQGRRSKGAQGVAWEHLKKSEDTRSLPHTHTHSLYLSLSRSHTHTRTHTHTHTHSLSLSLTHTISLTHTRTHRGGEQKGRRGWRGST